MFMTIISRQSAWTLSYTTAQIDGGLFRPIELSREEREVKARVTVRIK